MLELISYLIPIAVLAWTVVIYNRLVVDYNRVLTAWSDIDVQLKRRHDLVPKLVEAVRQYAGHEMATLNAVTTLRTHATAPSAGVAETGVNERLLGERLQRLVVLAEAYPDLKANQSFLDLQYNLTEIENQLQYARRYYNGAVRNLNVRVGSFPDMLVAKVFGFIPAQFFDFDGQD